MHFTSSLDGITPAQLGGFFEGWPNPPSPATLHRLLSQSYRISLAVEEGGQVVGFAQAISDGVLSAFIPLLEVHASHRGQGLGTTLLRHLLAQLDPLYAVDLSCEGRLVPFYERLGFQPGSGMFRRNFARQSGLPAA